VKEKIMLIAGCSHAAGFEIDGTFDSQHNRSNSFGNLFAKQLGYRPINIASGGATNPTISRSIIEWIENFYDEQTQELFVLIAWTESSRLELPVDIAHDYDSGNPAADWQDHYGHSYLRINQGWRGNSLQERKMLAYYQKFIADNLEYLEIISANLVLQIQFYLTSKKIDFLMCSTMHMFTETYTHLEPYINKIDKTKYIDLMNTSESFFWKYKNAGYENPKAKFWHHEAEPHRLYSEKLLSYINTKNS
jgi:hypothetical protein